MDFHFTLNGNPYHQVLRYAPPYIRRIEAEPIIRLEKSRASGHRYDNKGTGSAHVSIRGSYIKKGAGVTIKAIVSVDSDRFPIVFYGTQDDEGIQARVDVVGSKDTVAPERFCFRLMAITTNDFCGGVGALLYRNPFDKLDFQHSPPAPANYFLNNVHCK
ncbi:MAG: hypothetical protein IBX49_00230 [Gammaproteobacteria bacterium]|nr:hypothetical protein [Gammaproteobacteria bacterium]